MASGGSDSLGAAGEKVICLGFGFGLETREAGGGDGGDGGVEMEVGGSSRERTVSWSPSSLKGREERGVSGGRVPRSRSLGGKLCLISIFEVGRLPEVWICMRREEMGRVSGRVRTTGGEVPVV